MNLDTGKMLTSTSFKCFYLRPISLGFECIAFGLLMDFQLSILIHCNVFSPSSSPNVCVLFICICYKFFLHSSTKLYSFVMEFIIGMLSLQPLKHHQS